MVGDDQKGTAVEDLRDLGLVEPLESSLVNKGEIGASGRPLEGEGTIASARFAKAVDRRRQRPRQQQRKQQDADGQIPALPLPASLPGFSAEHWYLPDDSALGFVHIPAGRFTMGSNPAVDPMAYGNERWSATRRHNGINEWRT